MTQSGFDCDGILHVIVITCCPSVRFYLYMDSKNRYVTPKSYALSFSQQRGLAIERARPTNGPILMIIYFNEFHAL